MDRHRRAGPTARRRRSIRLIAALSIGMIASSFIPEPVVGAEDDEFIAGSGVSYAQIYRVGPTAGRLSLAPIFGLSLADYLSTVGRGETKVADWAGIGVAECSLPENTPALKVSSSQPGAEDGITQVVAGQGGSGIGELFARATKAPFGESRIKLSTLSVPGLIEAHDSVSHSKTGIVSDGLRQASAIAEIGSLSIGGGIVLMKGLKWEVLQQTGNKKTSTGKFTIDGLAIGGVPLPVPQDSDIATFIGPINTALAPTGFAISPPKLETGGGQALLTPLSLDVVNSPLGRQFLAPILEALQPAREPAADAFIQLAKTLVEAGGESSGCGGGGEEDPTAPPSIPDLTVGVLAADLTLGIFSGSSQLHIEFGGVSAFTEGQVFENPFDDVNLQPPVVAPTQTITTPGTPGKPAVPGTEGTAVDDEGELVAAPGLPGQRTIRGDKGGVAVAVGLIGLAVAIGLAAADWYRMRKSRLLAAGA